MINIVINATAATESGAFSIVKGFVEYIRTLNEDKYCFHLFTCTKSIFTADALLRVYEIPLQNWKSRIAWDNREFESHLIDLQIDADLFISFQNTCSRFKSDKYKGINQLVYYHQSLPLIRYPWNPFKREELKFFLYAHFYSFFVSRYNEKATYVVQLPYIKRQFCKKFKNINPCRVNIIKPNQEIIDTRKYIIYPELQDKFVMIFPAADYRYKNHQILVDSIVAILKEHPELKDRIIVLFTLDNDGRIAEYIKHKDVLDTIKCIGKVEHEILLNLYNSADCLLFPSRIETYGLPLIEAASFGMNVIAADLDYAHEVLQGYENVTYCDPLDVDDWKKRIEITLEQHRKTEGFIAVHENTWNDFMQIVDSLIK